MKKHLRGITLIELLVVLAIISILALVAYAGLAGARDEAKKVTVKADMDSLRPAAELYALKHDFQYSDFCTDPGGAVASVEAACIAVYPDCGCDGDPDGACTDSVNSWTVTCSTSAGDFSWTLSEVGTGAACDCVWEDVGCGDGDPCGITFMEQTRSCPPDCLDETRCVTDVTCE